jgi:hypothetical protein
MSTIGETIEQAVESWPGVEKLPHRFAGVSFRVKGHEIGHLHGSRQADLPFTVREREELVASGRASLHHVLPKTGWVTYSLHGPERVPALIELFRMNDERYSRPAASSQGR